LIFFYFNGLGAQYIEVELESTNHSENTKIIGFWITWEKMNTFPQYQISLWFRVFQPSCTVTTWAATDFTQTSGLGAFLVG
jgi:hypothetical protein